MPRIRYGSLLIMAMLGASGRLLAAEIALPGNKAELPTFVDAERIFGRNDQEMVAEGSVVLRKGINKLQAEQLIYREPLNEVEAKGQVRLWQNNDFIVGPYLKLRLTENIGYFDAPQYRIQRTAAAVPGGAPVRTTEGSGQAQRINFEGKNLYHLLQATYSTCGPDDPAWFAQAADMTLDYTEEVGQAHNARLVFQGVPLLYSPWLTFSLNNRRKSGLLAPTIGTTSKSGLEFTVPYFWNIAPNMDATIAPRLMTKRGLALDGEFRYLDYNYSGNFQGMLLPKDNVTGHQRDSYSFNHQQNFGRGFSGTLNLNRVSDDSYFSDLSSRMSNIAQNNLLRQGVFGYAASWWNASIMAQSFQTLQDPALPPVAVPYRRLPQLTLNATRADLPMGGVLVLRGELVHFSHPSQVEGTRTTLAPQLSLPLQTAAFFITPRLALNATTYHLDRQAAGVPERLERNVPIFSVDSGLVFERSIELDQRPMTQTLEPRLYYLRVPSRDQSRIPVFDSGLADFNFAQLFSDNRYSGSDRIGDANQLTLAVTSRLIDPENGAEWLRGALGQRIYFKDQEVTLPGEVPRTARTADYLAAVTGTLRRSLLVDAALQYNPHDRRMERLSAGLRYNPETGRALSASYRYNRDDSGVTNGIKQIDLAGQWPVMQNWSAVGRYNYSLSDRRIIEAIGGLEYNAGCWGTRVVLQRIATATGNSSTAFFIQLELNGFSSLGSNPMDVLKRSVPGYGRINQPAADPVFSAY